MWLSADRRTTLTNRNCAHEEINSRLNLGNVRNNTVESFFSPFDIEEQIFKHAKQNCKLPLDVGMQFGPAH
jgi:hypothetical protein